MGLLRPTKAQMQVKWVYRGSKRLIWNSNGRNGLIKAYQGSNEALKSSNGLTKAQKYYIELKCFLMLTDAQKRLPRLKLDSKRLN